MDSCCVNCLLIQRPFSSHKYNDQCEIIKTGRSKPSLPGLVSVVSERNRCYERHFSTENYSRYEWLSGCGSKNVLFCFPCLLFSLDKTSWTNSGFNGIATLTKAAQKHQSSQSHLVSSVAFLKFGKSTRINRLLDNQEAENTLHNENVKKNREVLKRLIDCVFFLANQELPFRDDESASSRDNFLELLHFLKDYDRPLDVYLKKATIFNGTDIQNDLISAISDVVFDEIKHDLEQSEFVSVLLDETSDVTSSSQLSTVVRYVDHSGYPQETFLGFTDVSSDRSASALFDHVCTIANTLSIENKLVAQTYDGAAVMSGQLNSLQSEVKNKYPEALFVHCYAHSLNLVLQQTTSCVKKCRIFFQTLNGLISFLSHSARQNLLRDFIEKKLPSLAQIRWNFTSRLIFMVEEHRLLFIDFFDSMVENSDEHKWKADDINIAAGFASRLKKFDSVFLLKIFSKIFLHSDVLDNFLQNARFDIASCQKQITIFLTLLKEMRNEGFSPIWMKVTEHTEVEPPYKKRRDDFETSYRQIFNQILDVAIMQIEERFANFESIGFVALLDSDKFSTYEKKFPQDSFNLLLSSYKKFDALRLKNELTVLYKDPEFRGKDIHELVLCLHEMPWVLTEILRLGQLILTIPSTTASVERSFSALKRIKTHLRSTQGQQQSDLSLISIEICRAEKLKSAPDSKFIDLVIKRFLEKNRRIDLIYK